MNNEQLQEQANQLAQEIIDLLNSKELPRSVIQAAVMEEVPNIYIQHDSDIVMKALDMGRLSLDVKEMQRQTAAQVFGISANEVIEELEA